MSVEEPPNLAPWQCGQIELGRVAGSGPISGFQAASRGKQLQGARAQWRFKMRMCMFTNHLRMGCRELIMSNTQQLSLEVETWSGKKTSSR